MIVIHSDLESKVLHQPTNILAGKVAIITGAAQGMGAMHARGFVMEGCKVVVADVQDEKGQKLVDELGHENATYMHLDVSSPENWEEVVRKTEELYGYVTILVNNAGIGVFKTLDELTVDDFMKTFKVDELGVFLGMKYCSASMKKAGGGSIVNISSVDGLVSAATAIAYSASKHAVTGMTKGAAVELGPHKIRVNSVHPGIIKSPMAEQDDVKEYLANLERDIPLRRRAEQDEVTEVVIFMASDVASYLNGTQIVLDGGLTCDL